MAAIKRAFTVAELMIGVAITSLVGLSVVGLAFGLSNAYESNDNCYQSLQTARSAMRQVLSAVRKSRLIVGKTDTELLLWVDDEYESGSINISELLLLRWDASSGELREHRMNLDSLPDEWKDMFNSQVPLNLLVTSPDSFSSWMRNQWYHESRVLADGITNFQTTGQSPVPMTRLLKVKISAGESGDEVALRSVVKIRADATDEVDLADGQYVLAGR